jgi:CIC family chloride channel protein
MTDTRPPLFERLRDQFAQAGAVEGVMLGLGALTGLLTGLLAAALIFLIREVQGLVWGQTVSWWDILLIPTIGALVVGIWLTYVAPESSGSGVTRVMESLALRGGRFRKRVPLTGLVATGLALGTGASGGRETPIALLGGATGSILGRIFTVDENRMRALVGAGVAAGIGASFNAPIGGMMFAIEIILGGLRARSLQVVVVSSVVGSVVARQIIGTGITFEPSQTYTFRDPLDLVVFAILGVVAAGFGVLLLRLESRSLHLFAWIRAHTSWRPLALGAGGLVVGLTALVVPEVLGTGDHLPPIDGIRDPIQHMLDGEYGIGWEPFAILMILFLAKLIATLASVGSGNAVGTFAPTLFMGAALGGALGAITTGLPGLDVEPGALSLVGMAAAFAAADKAPLTAILIAFELTQDYGLILPLMLACGLATYLSSLVEPDSVYIHPLRERGITFGQPDDVDVMQAVTVGEVMTRTHPTIRREETYDGIRELFERSGSHGFAVVDGGHRLVGVLTHTDLERAQSRDDVLVERRDISTLMAADLCTEGPVVVHPDEPVYTAVHRMAALDIGRIPVVERGSNRLVGLMRRADVLRAYQRGLNRHLGDQQRLASQRLRDLAGVTFLELTVHPDAAVAGQSVRDVSWPERTVLTTIRRMGRIVMPTGDTVLEAGDDVVVLTDQDSVGQVRTLMTESIGDALDPTDPDQRATSTTPRS